MTRSSVWILAACLSLAIPAAAGEIEPADEDFVVTYFDFGPKGTASAMAPGGSFVVAWDAYFCCMAAIGFDAQGNASQVWDLNPGFPATPDPIDVAALADDDFVVAWETYNDLFDQVIYARQFALDGTPLGVGIEVANAADGSINIQPAVDAWPLFGDQSNVDLAVGADNGFLVVWDGPSAGSDSDRSIQGRVYAPDQSALGPDFQINTWTTGSQSRPAVEGRKDGSYFVVWSSDQGIRGQVVAADGTLVRSEVGVNSTAAQGYTRPTVAGAFGSRFVVTWDSEEAAYYGDYRRARLFEDGLFHDGFESGDTSAWSVTVE